MKKRYLFLMAVLLLALPTFSFAADAGGVVRSGGQDSLLPGGFHAGMESGGRADGNGILLLAGRHGGGGGRHGGFRGGHSGFRGHGGFSGHHGFRGHSGFGRHHGFAGHHGFRRHFGHHGFAGHHRYYRHRGFFSFGVPFYRPYNYCAYPYRGYYNQYCYYRY